MPTKGPFTLPKISHKQYSTNEQQQQTPTPEYIIKIINPVYTHTINETTFDGMVLYQRGGLFVLKGFFFMNSKKNISIPQFLNSNGLEIVKMSLVFEDTSSKDVTINAIPTHPNTGEYKETYVSLTSITNKNIINTFGRDYQFANLYQIEITTANGTAGQKVYFIVTLKSIIPTDTY